MKNRKIGFGLLLLLLIMSSGIVLGATVTPVKKLTSQEASALSIKQAELVKEINKSVAKPNLDQAAQVKLAQKIIQSHQNKAKLAGRR